MSDVEERCRLWDRERGRCYKWIFGVDANVGPQFPVENVVGDLLFTKTSFRTNKMQARADRLVAFF